MEILVFVPNDIVLGNSINGVSITSNITRNHCVLTDGYAAAPESFMFSLRNNDDLPPFKSPLKDENTRYAIYRYSSYGPTFGTGFDLWISSTSYSNFGFSYQLPSGYAYSDSKTRILLAGSYYITPAEVEVLYLI